MFPIVIRNKKCNSEHSHPISPKLITVFRSFSLYPEENRWKRLIYLFNFVDLQWECVLTNQVSVVQANLLTIWSLVSLYFSWQDKFAVPILLGNLSKPRRQRQRERRQTKGLMRRTIAVLVRYKSLYISLPFSAKQQREMTKFRVFWRALATTANILDFPMELIAGITYLVWAGF